MCSFAKTSNWKTETKLQNDPEAKPNRNEAKPKPSPLELNTPELLVPIKAKKVVKKHYYYRRPIIFSITVYEWLQNNSTLKSTNWSHYFRCYGNDGRNGKF